MPVQFLKYLQTPNVEHGPDRTANLHRFVNNKSMDFMVDLYQAEGMFFSAYCDQVGTEVLLGPDNVLDVSDGPLGLELHYRCHCGDTGVVYPKLSRAAA